MEFTLRINANGDMEAALAAAEMIEAGAAAGYGSTAYDLRHVESHLFGEGRGVELTGECVHGLDADLMLENPFSPIRTAFAGGGLSLEAYCRCLYDGGECYDEHITVAADGAHRVEYMNAEAIYLEELDERGLADAAAANGIAVEELEALADDGGWVVTGGFDIGAAAWDMNPAKPSASLAERAAAFAVRDDTADDKVAARRDSLGEPLTAEEWDSFGDAAEELRRAVRSLDVTGVVEPGVAEIMAPPTLRKLDLASRDPEKSPQEQACASSLHHRIYMSIDAILRGQAGVSTSLAHGGLYLRFADPAKSEGRILASAIGESLREGLNGARVKAARLRLLDAGIEAETVDAPVGEEALTGIEDAAVDHFNRIGTAFSRLTEAGGVYRLGDCGDYVTEEQFEDYWAPLPEWHRKAWMLADNGHFSGEEVAEMTPSEICAAYDSGAFEPEHAFYTEIEEFEVAENLKEMIEAGEPIEWNEGLERIADSYGVERPKPAAAPAERGSLGSIVAAARESSAAAACSEQRREDIGR